jgi:hypothetical protein
MSVRNLLAALVGTGAIMASCATSGASLPANRYTVTEVTVCRAFNSAASPVAHLNSIDPVLARLAAHAKDPDIRRAGKELLQEHVGDESKPFYQIGAICVAKGLTPKDWPDLA